MKLLCTRLILIFKIKKKMHSIQIQPLKHRQFASFTQIIQPLVNVDFQKDTVQILLHLVYTLKEEVILGLFFYPFYLDCNLPSRT